MTVKVLNTDFFFLFKAIGVPLKDRYDKVLTVKAILEGKVHFYQGSIFPQGKITRRSDINSNNILGILNKDRNTKLRHE
jgi:hypothetical protein